MASEHRALFQAELDRGRDVVLISGYARLPDAVASHAQFDRIGVVLVVDADTTEVIAAEPTLLTSLAKDFFHALLCGRRLLDDPPALIAHVERHYQGGTGPALISALRKAMESLVTLRGGKR